MKLAYTVRQLTTVKQQDTRAAFPSNCNACVKHFLINNTGLSKEAPCCLIWQGYKPFIVYVSQCLTHFCQVHLCNYSLFLRLDTLSCCVLDLLDNTFPHLSC